jgi:hypothetical protein
MKASELATLYVLSLRYSDIVSESSGDIQMACEALVGDLETINLIKKARLAVDTLEFA